MMTLDQYLSSTNSASVLARKIGAHQVLISQWRHGSRPVPYERCPSIERATSGAVTCEELRPDVSWVRIPDPDWPHPQGRPLVDHTATRAADQLRGAGS